MIKRERAGVDPQISLLPAIKQKKWKELSPPDWNLSYCLIIYQATF